jgi:nucleotidyltransferase/DNA polymerase involved in DNA repair
MAMQVGHLDADCFYVSCERVRRRCLCGKAVGVLSNQGACVIAKSYELKARGVTTGMPIWDAVPLCPEAVFIKRDFQWYEVLSRKMLDVTRRFSPTVEYYSIDEMFFDAADIDFARAKALQKTILDEVGVPVSVGLSTSKTLAKMASSSQKPFGCVAALDEAEVQKLLDGRPVDKITGIAKRSRRRLEPYGIHTCLDFARADRRLIRRLLTKRGEDLWWELNGVAALPLQAARTAHKNLSRGGSLGVATADPDRVAAWVARNTERLVEALDYHQVFCEWLAMSLDFKDGGGAMERVRLPAATADFQTLHAAAQSLLAVCWTGDWSIFRRKDDFSEKTSAENIDLSPSRWDNGCNSRWSGSGHSRWGGSYTATPAVELSAMATRGGSTTATPTSDAAAPLRKASYMHLIAEGLVSRDHVQRSLFEPSDPRQQAIARVKCLINRQVGRFAVRSGATLPLVDIYRDETNSYDICDIHGKTCF